MTNVTRTMVECKTVYKIGKPDEDGVRFNREETVIVFTATTPKDGAAPAEAREAVRTVCAPDEIAVDAGTTCRPCIIGMTLADFCAGAHVMKYKD